MGVKDLRFSNMSKFDIQFILLLKIDPQGSLYKNKIVKVTFSLTNILEHDSSKARAHFTFPFKNFLYVFIIYSR